MASMAMRFVTRARTKLISPNNFVNAFMMRNPIKTSVGFTCIKTIAADLFTQKVIERKKEIDWRRNAVFGTFGFLYMGCFQYWLFNIMFFRWFPGRDLVQTIKKICADQFVKGPFFYFPVFYFVRTLIQEFNINEKTLVSIKTTYKREVWGDLKRFWSMWIPAHFITFGIMPIHLRLPWIATLSFFWCCILSYMHGNYDHEAEVEVAVAKEWELQRKKKEERERRIKNNQDNDG